MSRRGSFTTTAMSAIKYTQMESTGETKMNKYGYAWGVLSFLTATQACEGRVFFAFVLAAAGLVCLLMASTRGPD